MTNQLASVLSFVGERTATLPVAQGSRVVVVGSGKGGVGTSTVAALLALLLADRDERVLLVDAADGHAVQHLLLDAQLADRSGSVGPAARAPADLAIQVTPNLVLLPAEEGSRPGAPLSPPEKRARFRRLATLFPSYDTVVIDGGSRLESILTACEGGVNLLLVVTNADRICLAANYALVKAIGLRVGERPVGVVGNRLGDEAARAASDLIDGATQHFLRTTAAYVGAIPDDPSLLAGIASGMPIQEAAAGSPAAAAMDEIAAYVFETIPAVATSSGRRQLRRRS